MSAVTFLRDFRGRATAEQFYTAGQTVDLPGWQVAACLAEGVVRLAVLVGAEPVSEALTGQEALEQVASTLAPPVVEAGATESEPFAPVIPPVKPKRQRRKRVASEPD